jgi:hypothetical protein
MALVTITAADSATPEQKREWCERLEEGSILYFPQSPIPLSADDLQFLRGQQQTDSSLHKNIAYKPKADELSGLDQTANSATVERLRSVMRAYSQSVTQFLTRFLAPYASQWQLDYASFRPQEEQGRDLPLRRRNDLLHTDAFPTRPTHGARILRFFNNINETRTRDWIVSDPFRAVAQKYAPAEIALPQSDSVLGRAFKSLAEAITLRRLHDALPQFPQGESGVSKLLRKIRLPVPARVQLDGLHRYGAARCAQRTVRAGADVSGRARGDGRPPARTADHP